MTTNEVIEFLNNHGLPVDYRFFKVLKETTNVVQKVGTGRWVFDKDPIHYKTLQKAYDEYRFLKANKRNLYNKDNQIKDAIKLIVPPLDLQNRFAAFVEQVDKSKAVEGLYSSLCL